MQNLQLSQVQFQKTPWWNEFTRMKKDLIIEFSSTMNRAELKEIKWHIPSYTLSIFLLAYTTGFEFQVCHFNNLPVNVNQLYLSRQNKAEYLIYIQF